MEASYFELERWNYSFRNPENMCCGQLSTKGEKVGQVVLWEEKFGEAVNFERWSGSENVTNVFLVP